MSYYNAEEGNYTQGVDDFYFVFFCMVVFTGARVAVMEYILKPFARANGISTKKGLTRFEEQGWMFIYYSIAWGVGMVSLRIFSSAYRRTGSYDSRLISLSTSCTTPITGST